MSYRNAVPALAALVATLLPGVSEARIHSNTQQRLPNNLYTADVNGDNIAEFLAVKDDKVLVAQTSLQAYGMAYFKTKATIKRIISGNFTDKTKQQVCALLSNSTISCYGAGTDNKSFSVQLSQSLYMADSDQAFVGDFNADGYDDLLLYTPSSGKFAMYTRLSGGTFGAMPRFTLGDLSSSSGLMNKQVRVGEFTTGASVHQDDLLVYDSSTQKVAVLGTTKDSYGNITFKTTFITNSGMVASDEEVTVANVDGDNTDDVVLHSRNNGTYRFFKAQVSSGRLVSIANVSTGQLATNKNSQLLWASMHGKVNEPGNTTRDDVLVYDPYLSIFIRADARWSGSAYTYYWAYNQYPLQLDLDQDGDAIKTIDELGGYDVDNNGVSDEQLNSYGCSPFVPDILVEVDYMDIGPGETASHVMKSTAVNLSIQEMAKFGINLHVMISDKIPHQSNLGNPDFDWTRDFDPIKNAHFAISRAPFFHYCVFACKYGNTGSSGRSRDYGASDFLVTLGTWSSATSDMELSMEVGTFLHELGHNLGLRHGGTDDDNSKLNHLSIMNYIYQLSGVYKDGAMQFLYSELSTRQQDENNLKESEGVSADTLGHIYKIYWYDDTKGMSVWTPLNTPMDFNWDGKISSGVAHDLNWDSAKTVLAGSTREYDILQFKGGAVGSAGSSTVSYARTDVTLSRMVAPLMHESPMEELDLDQIEDSIELMFEDLPPLKLEHLGRQSPRFQPLLKIDG